MSEAINSEAEVESSLKCKVLCIMLIIVFPIMTYHIVVGPHDFLDFVLLNWAVVNACFIKHAVRNILVAMLLPMLPALISVC